MQNIEIEITKAVLTSFTVDIKKDKIPEIDATIKLLTFNNKKITEFKASTGTWTDNKMDLSVEVYHYIKKIEEILEIEATRCCRANMKLLPMPNSYE